MAKINKEEEARRSGMAYAYKIALEKGVDGLQKELQYRNITKAPLSVPQTEIDRFCAEVKNNCVVTFKVMTMLTLHDEFGFGQKRLEQFMERFMTKVECITEDYATWGDYQDILNEECKMKIQMSDEFLNMGKGNNMIAYCGVLIVDIIIGIELQRIWEIEDDD